MAAPVLQFVLADKNIRVWSGAIQCLARIGKEISLEWRDNEVRAERVCPAHTRRTRAPPLSRSSSARSRRRSPSLRRFTFSRVRAPICAPLCAQ